MAPKQFPRLISAKASIPPPLFPPSLSLASLMFIDSASFIIFHWLAGAYSYALGVLILKKWPSNGVSWSQTWSLALSWFWLIWFTEILLLSLPSVQRLDLGGGNICNVRTSGAGFCRVSMYHVILGWALWWFGPDSSGLKELLLEGALQGEMRTGSGRRRLHQWEVRDAACASFCNTCSCFCCLFFLVVNNSWSELASA